jgi:hypothetical protein
VFSLIRSIKIIEKFTTIHAIDTNQIINGNEYGIDNAASQILIPNRLRNTATNTNAGCLYESNNKTAIQKITNIAIINDVHTATKISWLLAASHHETERIPVGNLYVAAYVLSCD